MEEKQRGRLWTPKTKKILAAVLVFGLIFTGNLVIAKAGAMKYVSKAGLKIQHLFDGQKKTFADSTNTGEKLVPAGEVTKERSFRQPLEISDAMLAYKTLCISVKTGTFGRINEGEFVLEFRQGDYVVQNRVDVSKLPDNSDVRLDLDGSKLSVGEAVVSCYSDSEEGSAITVICTDQCLYRDFFYINEEKMGEKNLKMKIYVPF